MLSDTTQFYKQLPARTQFSAITDPQSYQAAPDDWVVIITDVIGSTRAIEAGHHKDVNVAGVATIIALRNKYQKFEFPYVFGGDGATFLLPESMLSEAKDVLAETRRTCQDLFGLPLRVGFVPVRTLRATGHDVNVAKLKVSKVYEQAVLTGSGIDYAEVLVKDEQNDYLLPLDYQPTTPASYLGLFCPFTDIQGAKEETISLIIKVRSDDPAQRQGILTSVLNCLDETLGNEGSYHPLANDIQIRWATARQTSQLVRLSARTDSGWKPRAFWLIHKFFHFLTRLSVGSPTLVQDADFRKFDGSLKMVIACSKAERELLEKFLEQLYQQGQIFYGVHVSAQALVTCCMHFNTMNGPIHFVDGADGGYAFAARQLKQQIAAQKGQ